MNYIKTDKNGTEYYEDWKCPRCGGQGAREEWAYTGSTCYKCGGSGRAHKPTIIKKYTPEYRAKLDKQAELKWLAKVEKDRAEWLPKNGFTPEGLTYIFVGDTYDIRESIKATGAVYCREIGWHISHNPAGFSVVEARIEDVCDIDVNGNYSYKPQAKVVEPSKSQYIGSIGEKISAEVKLEHVFWVNTAFGMLGIHKSVDKAGNVLIWKTSADIGEFKAGTITGTVKEHSEYNGVKQTVLTRCKTH